MASPLTYIIQAAMGQCSTLPAEGRNDSASTTNYTTASSKAQQRDDVPTTGYHRYVAENGAMANGMDASPRHKASRHGNGYSLQVNTLPQNGGHGNQPRFGHTQVHNVQPPSGYGPPPPPYHPHHPSQQHQQIQPQPQPMQEEPQLPPPPEAAVRTRCYKLNLNSDLIGLASDDIRLDGKFLGPFGDMLPPLTCSSSEDSAIGVSATTIAIQTAQIFRGITISKDGTILSQNARATRSNRGNKQKRGEKSRQATKIDKAKDLVEEEVLTGKVSERDDIRTNEYCKALLDN